ncbi:MAG: hypothetical protein PHR21_04665 [Oscillospiraceae bacterium]|nr:hypothetical protein [Oscillospiraceae bacterium]MDD4369013.1 hypothetical protein [Oscillospiraceae bacterium]
MNKKSIRRLSEKGQLIEKSSATLKDPNVIEFLGLEEKAAYCESGNDSVVNDVFAPQQLWRKTAPLSVF